MLLKIYLAFVAFVGFVFLALATYLFIRRLFTRLRGSATVGRVVGHESRKDDDGGVSYFPIVEFADLRGAVHRFRSFAGSSGESPAVGAMVRVRYLPQNPRMAYIQSFLHMW